MKARVALPATVPNANRLTAVRHGPSLQSPLYETEYTWTRNNWVDYRTEIDNTVNPATTTVVDFTYDNRGRLIGETRLQGSIGVPPVTGCDIVYTHDQLDDPPLRRRGTRIATWAASTAQAARRTYFLYFTEQPNGLVSARGTSLPARTAVSASAT